MQRVIILSLIFIGLSSCYSNVKNQGELKYISPKEANGLLKMMYQIDQQFRDSLYNGNQKNISFFTRKIVENDASNLKLLDKIVQHHGWPGISIFGENGAETAWLVIWHHRDKRSILCKYHSLMEACVKKGDMKFELFRLLDEQIARLSPDQIEY